MAREEIIRQALKTHPISELVAERMAKDPAYAEQIREVRAAVEPILRDLANVGFQVESLSELRTEVRSWEPTIPVLLHWLPLVHNLAVKEDIIRCISVPWTGSRATGYLIEEFKKYAPIDPEHAEDVSRLSASQFLKYASTIKKRDPSSSLAWTIGNALSIVGVKEFEKEIIKLCRNRSYGIARQMMVMTLHRLRDTEAEETALDLLEDADVRLHAIIALGKMKSKRALFQLEKLLKDKNASMRKEARKAITKIMR